MKKLTIAPWVRVSTVVFKIRFILITPVTKNKTWQVLQIYLFKFHMIADKYKKLPNILIS